MLRRPTLFARFLLAGATAAAIALPIAGVAAPAAAATSSPVSGFASTTTGGWYISHFDGTVDPGGGARDHGDMAGTPLNRPVTGIASTPSGRGYWLVASDGGIFSFGDARFYGSTGGMVLNRAIVGMASTPTGRGYWLVATDGGIFSFGDARFYGSTGGIVLNRPIVGMASTARGRGYWLVASDGGIFSFGDARFHGSTGAVNTGSPIVGMASTSTGNGYWLVTSLGRVYAFGDAHNFGSPSPVFGRVVGITRRLDAAGYVVVDTGGYHVRGVGADWSVRTQPATTLTAEQKIALDLVARANDERAARGLGPLTYSLELSGEAGLLADRMADNNTLTHYVDFNSLFVKFNATAGGENIAYTGYPDVSSSAHNMWMNSSGHRTNLLNPGFDRVGIGVVCRGGVAWISQVFLRVGSGALNWSTPPLNPIVRTDSDPTAGRHC